MDKKIGRSRMAQHGEKRKRENDKALAKRRRTE
jgi:hypothetical protein